MDSRDQLLEMLARAQSQGFLGPGEPADHLSHALGFAEAAEEQCAEVTGRYADLGTGGGVPGLALALRWPEVETALVESSARRCEALRDWVTELGIAERVQVLEGRAEAWAHAEGFREAFDLVTARSFARPAVTAEIAGGLVRLGGLLIVSDPPEPAPERWPVDGLAELGFGPPTFVVARAAHYACLRKTTALPADLPRPIGRPGKRPRW